MTVDVLMPVYKTPIDQVKQAVQSVLDQSTNKRKLIIVDDGNPKGELTDYLYGELASLSCCITIVRMENNGGVAAALSRGLEYCKNELVFRMDADDVAHKNWISRVVHFFEDNPSAVICGVQVNMFNETGFIRHTHHPDIITRQYAIENDTFWLCNHPGIAYKRDVVMALGGYDPAHKGMAEDYALWIKFLKAGYVIHNLPDILIDYRLPSTDPEKVAHRHSDEWLNFLKTQKAKLND